MVHAMKTVDSSLIHSTGYDPASRTLAVIFKNGHKRYEYRDVPPEVAQKLDRAESIGKAFGEHVRGKFDHTMTTIDHPAHPHHSESHS